MYSKGCEGMGECTFCKIINRELDSQLIYETESMISFLDIDPINEGHILIVPKIHVDSIDQVPLEVLSEMLTLVQKILPIYKKLYGIEGYSMMQNGGKFCDFGHFHLHLFPRYTDDGFGWTYPEGTFEYSQEVAERIRKVLVYEERL